MISLAYGNRQTFRYRYEDINILGSTSLTLPVKRSEYRLNDGQAVHFYIERRTKPDDPPLYAWKARTPAVNRLRDQPGHFNIEIPVNSHSLRTGKNQLHIAVEDRDGRKADLSAVFTWDPAPVNLPLDLSDLRQIDCIQTIAQAVNGVWDLDKERNVIAARVPISHDALLLLGSSHRSQVAVYNVQFPAPMVGAFIGLSDYFVRHEEQSLGLGIKPGYSTAGLAVLDPLGGGLVNAMCWMSIGDCMSGKDWAWVRKSAPAFVLLSADVLYTVRHQVIFDDDVCLVRFRIWRSETREPDKWLSTVNNAALEPRLPRATSASFGLFQYCDKPALYSNIRIRELESRIRPEDLTASGPLVDGWRNAQYQFVRLSKRIVRAVAAPPSAELGDL